MLTEAFYVGEIMILNELIEENYMLFDPFQNPK